MTDFIQRKRERNQVQAAPVRAAGALALPGLYPPRDPLRSARYSAALSADREAVAKERKTP